MEKAKEEDKTSETKNESNSSDAMSFVHKNPWIIGVVLAVMFFIFYTILLMIV